LGPAAAAVLLSGCMTLMGTSSPEPAVSGPDAASPSVQLDSTDALIDFEAQVLQTAPAPPPAPETLPPAPKPKPVAAVRPPPEVTVAQLIGLRLEEATSLLGKPNLRTEMPPAKVFAYHGKTCTLNLFFYLDLKTDEYRSLTYVVKGDDQSEPAKQRCLTEIVGDGSV
jgi:hypothetical protein